MASVTSDWSKAWPASKESKELAAKMTEVQLLMQLQKIEKKVKKDWKADISRMRTSWFYKNYNESSAELVSSYHYGLLEYLKAYNYLVLLEEAIDRKLIV